MPGPVSVISMRILPGAARLVRDSVPAVFQQVDDDLADVVGVKRQGRQGRVQVQVQGQPLLLQDRGHETARVFKQGVQVMQGQTGFGKLAVAAYFH